jgi:hypothetical protein
MLNPKIIGVLNGVTVLSWPTVGDVRCTLEANKPLLPENPKTRPPLAASHFAKICFAFGLLGYAFDNVSTPFRCLSAQGLQCLPPR